MPLADLTQLAERLGLSSKALYQLHRRRAGADLSVPEPAHEHGRFKLYDVDAYLAWYAEEVAIHPNAKGRTG